MATIERVIDGRTWTVSPDGSVRTITRTLIYRGELTVEARGYLSRAKTAIALYEEWQTLKAQEDLDAPPRVELPGPEWHFSREGKDWLLYGPEGYCWRVFPRENRYYIANRLCIAAADELASRHNTAEHETRGAK